MTEAGWASPGARPDDARAVADAVAPAAGPVQAVHRTAAVTAAGPARPGVPLRPLSIGELLDGTFAMIRRNPRTVYGLSAVVVTALQLLFTGLEALTGDLAVPVIDFSGGSDSGSSGFTATLLVEYPVSGMVGALLAGLVALVAAEDVLGRRPTLGEVWAKARRRPWALLAGAFVGGVAPYLALVLLVAPGVILWAAFALLTPALMVEGLGPLRAAKRSWRLAWPSWGRVFSVRLLALLVGLLLELVLVLPFTAGGQLLASFVDTGPGTPGRVALLVADTVGDIVSGTVVAPFSAGVLALLYVDRRMRAEGLDIAWRRRELRAGAAA